MNGPLDHRDLDYFPPGEPWPNGPDARTQPQKPKMIIEWFDEAANSALSEPANPLIEDLLDEGALSVIYGDSGSGKTFVALDMGFHVGAGLDWNGEKVRHGLVVYVAAEGGRRIKRRIAALRKRYHEEYGEVAPEPLFALVRYPIDLRSSNADLIAYSRLSATPRKKPAKNAVGLSLTHCREPWPAATKTRPSTWAASSRRPIGSGPKPTRTSPMSTIPEKTLREARAGIHYCEPRQIRR